MKHEKIKEENDVLRKRINELEEVVRMKSQVEKTLREQINKLEGDILQYKNKNEELRCSEDLLNEAGKIAKIGGWEMEMTKGGRANWTKGTYDIVELDYDQPVPGFNEHVSWYLPEYREMIENKMKKLALDHDPMEFIARLKTAKGNIIWTKAIGEAVIEHNKCIKLRGTFQDITAYKEVEEKLKQNQFRLQEAEQIGKMGHVDWDVDNQKAYWSEEVFHIYECDSDQEPPGYDEIMLLHVPEDAKRLESAVSEALLHGTPYDIDLVAKTPSGKRKYLHVIGRPVKNENGQVKHIKGIVQDITERKKVEEALKIALESSKQKENEITELLNSAHDVLEINDFNQVARRIFDACSRVIGANAGYVALLSENGEENELLFLEDGGMPCSVNPELPMPIRGLRAEAYETGKVVYDNDFMKSEWVEYMPEGHMALPNVLFAPLNIEGKTVGIMGFACKKGDFTEKDAKMASTFGEYAAISLNNSLTLKQLKDHEHILEDVNRQLQQNTEQLKRYNIQLESNSEELKNAKEKAEESDRLKSAFLANMSHEIRTPMNGILGFTELLKKPDLEGDKQQQYVDIIYKSGERMLDTINDIIEISKIETGQVETSYSYINLNVLFNYYFNFFKPEADKKGIKLDYQVDLSYNDAFIKSDKSMLNSILVNLIKNALKYTHEGSIEFGCSEKSSMLEIYVKDTGIGIKEEHIATIFERFKQADIEDKNAYEGSGLGLSIVKSYAELLNGRVWVESEFGKGSVFYLALPCKKYYKKDNNFVHPGKQQNFNTEDAKFNILLAEDDEVSAMHISILLEEVANEMFIAKNGAEAVELCKKNNNIDVILMDIKMPVMNGYEATRTIRKFNQDIIIIAQTAYAMEGERGKAIEAGCNEYITKPIQEETLTRIMHEILIKR